MTGRRRDTGFSLLELAVVLGIIGVVAQMSISSGVATGPSRPWGAWLTAGSLIAGGGVLATVAFALLLTGAGGLLAAQIPPLLGFLATPGITGTPRVLMLRAIPGGIMGASVLVLVAALAVGGAGSGWLAWQAGGH